MSGQSKYYDYYKVEGADVKALIDSYDDISNRRNEVLQEAINKVGAVAWIDSRSFGDKGDELTGFVWSADYQFPCLVTIKDEMYFENKPVIVVRGKGNTNSGREFNKFLDGVRAYANSKLPLLPCWQGYIIKHYNIMRTGIGGPAGKGGRGFAMLTTYGGKAPSRDDCLLFAIPNDKDEKNNGKINIPENFQKLTYGQFYDMTETEGD